MSQSSKTQRKHKTHQCIRQGKKNRIQIKKSNRNRNKVVYPIWANLKNSYGRSVRPTFERKAGNLFNSKRVEAIALIGINPLTLYVHDGAEALPKGHTRGSLNPFVNFHLCAPKPRRITRRK